MTIRQTRIARILLIINFVHYRAFAVLWSCSILPMFLVIAAHFSLCLLAFVVPFWIFLWRQRWPIFLFSRCIPFHYCSKSIIPNRRSSSNFLFQEYSYPFPNFDIIFQTVVVDIFHPTRIHSHWSLFVYQFSMFKWYHLILCAVNNQHGDVNMTYFVKGGKTVQTAGLRLPRFAETGSVP